MPAARLRRSPPQAPKASREEMRFNRYDKDRDDLITRNELMSSRTRDFRKLDTDGNNLLTFRGMGGGDRQSVQGRGRRPERPADPRRVRDHCAQAQTQAEMPLLIEAQAATTGRIHSAMSRLARCV